MSKIIAINSGSSSLKFTLYQMPEEIVLTSGQAERIGLERGVFTISVKGKKISTEVDIPNHKKAIELMLDGLVKYHIVSPDGMVYGYAIAADTGLGMMEGTVAVDLFMASYEDSCRWGAHYVDIYVLSEGNG